MTRQHSCGLHDLTEPAARDIVVTAKYLCNKGAAAVALCLQEHSFQTSCSCASVKAATRVLLLLLLLLLLQVNTPPRKLQVQEPAAAAAATAEGSQPAQQQQQQAPAGELPDNDKFAQQFLQQSGLLQLRPPLQPAKSGNHNYTVVPYQV
jgi:hypothetical protein